MQATRLLRQQQQQRQSRQPPPPLTGMSAPPQRIWSNRTLILLSTAVGASMFMAGARTGYEQGKDEGLRQAAAAAVPPGTTSTSPTSSG
ncbi:unnamed protein product [Sympodiomycopsis kandeliae]